jgi:putative aldouronate transport system substrate-binding protein
MKGAKVLVVLCTLLSLVAAAAMAQSGAPVKLVLEKPIWISQPVDSPSNTMVRAKLKDVLGIDIQVIGDPAPQDQQQKANLMLAAGEQIDFFQAGWIGNNSWHTYKDAGQIIPLNDLLNRYGKDFLKSVDKAALKACTDVDGKIWAIPYEQAAVSSGFMIRKDWLDKNNLAVPTTIADFEKVMSVLKAKENDQGFVQAWASNTNGLLDGYDTAFARSFTPAGAGNFVDKDGKLKPFYVHPKYRDFLAKMAEWYTKGFLHREITTMQYQQYADTFKGGKSSTAVDWFGSIDDLNKIGRQAVPSFNAVVVAPPKGPEGNGIAAGLTIVGCEVVTKTCKNPEAVMKYINYTLGIDEGWLLSFFGVEGKHWSWTDKSKNVLKFAEIPQDQRYEINEALYIPGFINDKFFKFTIQGSGDVPTLKLMNDKSKYPSFFPPDFDVAFDQTTWKSKDKINALTTMLVEAKAKILMGQMKASDWDTTIKNWMDQGGRDMIDDMTAQYKAVHP